MARRIIVLAAGVLVLAGLTVGRSTVLGRLENPVGPTLVKEDVDLGSAQVITWEPELERWPGFEGEGRLALAVTRDCPLQRGGPLKLAVTITGIGPRGGESDRRIREWYLHADAPMDATSGIWESGYGNVHEFGLAGVTIRSFERLHIGVEVVEPDPRLATCFPRLQFSQRHDGTFDELLPTFRVTRDVIFGILVCSLAALMWFAWRRGQ